MVLTLSFYIALTLFVLGLLVRVSRWLRMEIGTDPDRPGLLTTVTNGTRAVFRILLSPRLIKTMAALITDIALQLPLLKNGFLRWLAHMCMCYGFLLLVLMHALDKTITAAFFPDYAATLNPFLFLRNFFGAMVILGMILTSLNRFYRSRKFKATNTADLLLMALLALIIFSGFLLESVKIFSEPVFDRMVEDYMGTEDTESLTPLKAYWSREYHVVFSQAPESDDLETGRNLHMENCAACHSRPEAAFLSLPLSACLKPLAGWLNQNRADLWLWYFHFGVCFLSLILLPFTKCFHLISVPLSLILRAADPAPPHPIPPQTPTRLSLEMDACTHCGVCSEHCSVAPIRRIIPNDHILPSEKLAGVKKLAYGKKLGSDVLGSLSQGSFICTGCYRCTERCPSGISLQTLWQVSKQSLVAKDFPEPHGWVGQYAADQWADRLGQVKTDQPLCKDFALYRHVSESPETFSACIQCSICTNVCPVVSAGNGLTPPDMTPQQVMNLMRLNLKDLALGSRMVWDCVTCYLCQEHCPQGIRVTDILYDLRNIATRRLQQVRRLGPETLNPVTADASPPVAARKNAL